MRYEVIGDNYSNHNLPIGAVVELVPAEQLEDWQDGHWYSMGIVGDEVAIDPRDLRQVSA